MVRIIIGKCLVPSVVGKVRKYFKDHLNLRGIDVFVLIQQRKGNREVGEKVGLEEQHVEKQERVTKEHSGSANSSTISTASHRTELGGVGKEDAQKRKVDHLDHEETFIMY